MTIGDRVIGVVRWVEARRSRRFSRDDERLALTLISQASIALENARLFRQAEQRAHAKIIFENGHCKLKDWQASHPSELNGALLEMGRQYPLKDGDRMRVGATLLVVRRL